MAINCNLYCVQRGAIDSDCSPSLAGTGDSVYIFDIEECFPKGLPEPTGGIYKTADIIGTLEGDALSSETNGIQKRCAKIDIKSDSGQVTSEKAEGSDFRQLTGTAIVDHHIDDFLPTDFALAFKRIGVLIPCTSGADSNSKLYYVLMSKYKKVKYSSNYDSGTTYDSDHGFTITFTVAPVTSACPLVRIPTDVTLKDPAK